MTAVPAAVGGLPETLPHDLDLERAALGAALLDLEAARVVAALAPGDLWQPEHRVVLSGITELLDRGQTPDLVGLTHHLRTAGQLEAVGGAAYLAALLDTVPDVVSAATHVGMLRDLGGRRRALEVLTRASTGLQLGHGLDLVAKVAAELAVIAETGRPTTSAVVVRTLSQVLEDPSALEPPEAVVPRLAWRGRLTLLAGREKSGKSTFAGWAAAAVTRGCLWLGFPTCRGPVILVDLEEAVGDIARRMVEAEADPDLVYLLDGPLSASRWRSLVAEIERLQPVLVIVDSLAALGSGRVRDWSSAAEVEPVMRDLVELARSGPAVVVLHHAAKSSGAYRDSTAIGASVDVLLTLAAPDAADGLRELRAVGRIPGLRSYSVRFTPEGGFEHADAPALSARDRVLSFVRNNAGATTRQIRGGVSARGRRVDDELCGLVAEGQIQIVSGDRGSKRYYTRSQIAAGEHDSTVSGGALETGSGHGAGHGHESVTVSDENPTGHGADTVGTRSGTQSEPSSVSRGVPLEGDHGHVGRGTRWHEEGDEPDPGDALSFPDRWSPDQKRRLEELQRDGLTPGEAARRVLRAGVA